MFDGIRWYFQKEVRPRLCELLSELELWFSIILGVVLGYFYSGNCSAQLPGLFSGLLTYASIAFGFCIAGLTLALTLPDREFANKIANLKVDTRKHDAYSALLFVFSWTALFHWIAIIVFLIGIITIGTNWGTSITIWKRVYLGGSVFVTSYSFLMFLSTLITLAQLGNTYIDHLKGSKKKK